MLNSKPQISSECLRFFKFVKRDQQIAKFWLAPVCLKKNRGFKNHELNQIDRLVADQQTTLLEAWHDYFDT